MNRKLIKDLMDAIKASDRKKTSGYDTSAVVRRIEDGTAWVHIPGGVDETPVKLTINASVGDTVQVRVSGGRAFLVGNRTAPPTDDTTAIKATYVAKNAQETAVEAKSEASEAWHYAGTAKEAAESAQDSADSAAEAAIEAWNHADDAHQAAVSANNSANNALVQLSVVEDVAGTLRWISEHGSYVPTTDTTVIEGSVYFIYENGDYIPIANPDPSANPSQEGWYVLDVTESQAKYIMAHLAVTSAGLWVLPVNQMAEHPLVDSDDNQIVDSDDNPIVDFSEDPQHASGYKVLLSGTGMTVYNDEGASVAFYGETTRIGAEYENHIYIDSDSVDIMKGNIMLAKFDGDGVTVYNNNNEVAKFYNDSQGNGKIKLHASAYEDSNTEVYAGGTIVDLFGDDSVGQQYAASVNTNGVYKSRYMFDGIYTNNSGEPVGTVKQDYASASGSSEQVATSTWVTCGFPCSITPGTWLVTFGGAFESNASGMRYFVLNTSSSTSVSATRQDIRVAPASGGQTSIQSTRIVTVSADTDLYLHAYQNSGSSLMVYPIIKAVKIV